MQTEFTIYRYSQLTSRLMYISTPFATFLDCSEKLDSRDFWLQCPSHGENMGNLVSGAASGKRERPRLLDHPLSRVMTSELGW